MLKAVVTKDEYSALDPAIQELYGDETGDKRVLAVTSVDGMELADTKSLRTALQSERSKREAADKAVKRFGDLDPEAARSALEKVDEIANWDPDEKLKKAKGEFEAKVKAQFDAEHAKHLAKHQADLGEVTKERDLLDSQLATTLVDAALTKAITDAEGSVNLLIHPLKAMVKMKVLDDGRRVPIVVDPDGTERISSKTGAVEPMGMDELVAEFKADAAYAPAFKGTGTSGSGATGGGATGAAGSGQFTITAEAARDTRAYREVRDRAEKAGKTVTILDS